MSDGAKGSDEDDRRSAAEWVTFTVSSLVLAAVVALVVAQLGGADGPARPVAEVSGPVEEHPEGFAVPVEVTNVGHATAAQVQVTAELTIDGEATEADQVVDFLAADEVEELTFTFADDPADGELVVRVASFAIP
jgi:uncharacterized protein (TIGR02588 family)